ncbi:hypothetical protein [Salana multivorans]
MTTTRPLYPPGTSPVPPRQTARGAFPDQLVPAQTPYERLPRTLAGYTWWRLALAALIAVAVWAVGQMVIIVPTMFTGTDPFELQDRLLNLDALDVPILLVALGSLAILIPAIWFGMWVMRLRPAWVVSSVVGRLRWRWMLRCGLYAVATLLVSLGAGLLVELGRGSRSIRCGLRGRDCGCRCSSSCWWCRSRPQPRSTRSAGSWCRRSGPGFRGGGGRGSWWCW